MSDAIAQIKAQQAQAKLKAQADYALLTDALARNEPAPPDVLTVLANANKTADQLEKAVAIAKERIGLEPRAAAFQSILDERARVEQQLKDLEEKVNAELKVAYEKADARLAPLRKRVDELKQAEVDSRYAKQRLLTLTNDARKAAGDTRNAFELAADSEEE